MQILSSSLFSFGDRISWSNPNWPGTHVKQGRLEFRDPPASVFWVWGLKAVGTTTSNMRTSTCHPKFFRGINSTPMGLRKQSNYKRFYPYVFSIFLSTRCPWGELVPKSHTGLSSMLSLVSRWVEIREAVLTRISLTSSLCLCRHHFLTLD